MKNKSLLSKMKYFILGCFLAVNINHLSAQSSNIYELTEQDFQNTSVSNKVAKSATFGKSIDNVKQGFFSLKKGLKPTIYVDNNKIKKVNGGVSPIILKYQNSYSLEALKENNSLIRDVELLTIKIKNQNELNNRFDFSNIDGFDNLKYIYIQCNFDCTANDISSFILNADPKVIIFYMVSNPS
jgi:hypothetical protein